MQLRGFETWTFTFNSNTRHFSSEKTGKLRRTCTKGRNSAVRSSHLDRTNIVYVQYETSCLL